MEKEDDKQWDVKGLINQSNNVMTLHYIQVYMCCNML